MPHPPACAGESVPVRKVAYHPVADGLSYDPDKQPACTLFSGTNVAQARAARGQKAIAMVVRTRFYSAKGQLLRWGDGRRGAGQGVSMVPIGRAPLAARAVAVAAVCRSLHTGPRSTPPSDVAPRALGAGCACHTASPSPS